MKVEILKYHLEMMLSELQNKKPTGGDTRIYLSLDCGEVEIIKELLLIKLESLK